MDHMLQIVLAVVVLAVGAFLVPLIIQLNRTAKAIETLAESAREDLNHIAQDIHQVHLQLEKVAVLAEASLTFPATLSAIARSAVAMLGKGQSPWMDALVTAVKIGIDFFRRPRKAAQKEAKNE